MIYNIKLALLKFLKLPIFKTLVNRCGFIKTGDDIRAELIKKYAFEKSFADIGSMWRVNGSFSFLAEKSGAKKVISVDLYKTEEFINRKKELNSRIEFIQGDIHQDETINKITPCDVIFCSGVLYHSPNPIQLLSQIKKICKETFILVTMVIPEISGRKNTSVFYPFLSDNQKKYWNLPNTPISISDKYYTENPYINWYWGFSPSCVESMLKCVNFEIKERYVRPLQAFYVCSIR